MILTCPECATGYFVKDDEIPSRGRTVRCASCGTRWTAYPEGGLDLKSEDRAASEPALESEPTGAAEEPTTLTADELPRAFRDRAEEERRMRRAALNGVIAACVGVAIIVAVGLAILFRDSVVRAWPRSASLYAAIGLPVNPTGLTIEQVKAEAGLHDGRATLDVSGVIRNIAGHEVTAPPLRIAILNGDGKRVAGEIADLDNARIPAGQARYFTTSIANPPASQATLAVDFVLDGRSHAAATARTSPASAAPVAPPGFTLRGASNGAADAGDSADAMNAAPSPSSTNEALPP